MTGAVTPCSVRALDNVMKAIVGSERITRLTDSFRAGTDTFTSGEADVALGRGGIIF